jgi:hypothetical protein
VEEELHSYLAEGEAQFFAPPDLGLVASSTAAPAVTAVFAPKTITASTTAAPSTATFVQPKQSPPATEPAPTTSSSKLTATHYEPPSKPTGDEVKVPEIVFGPPPAGTVPVQNGGSPPPPVAAPTNPPGTDAPRARGGKGGAWLGLGVLGLLAFLVWQREKDDKRKGELRALPDAEEEDDS